MKYKVAKNNYTKQPTIYHNFPAKIESNLWKITITMKMK